MQTEAKTTLESILDVVLQDLVDDRDRYLGPEGDKWLIIGSDPNQRENFSNTWTPQAHSEARQISRQLCDQNPFALNGIENRINYVVGTGHEYLISGPKGEQPDESLLTAIDQFLEEYRRLNKWHTRQIETQRRFDRDGEVFLRQFVTGGTTVLRYIEPELVRPPEGREDIPFGIQFEPEDVETPVRYYLGDSEAIEAEDVQHRKANVDLTAPRGVPLYWPVRRNLKRTHLLLRNMSALVEIQTAISLIRKHKGTSVSALQTNRANQADATAYNSTTGKTDYFKQYGPGTILDAPESVEYEFPSHEIDAEGWVGVLKAELRSIAARLVMPEFMFTSDASNAAYASTMVAEGPAVRQFQRLQQTSIHDDLALQYTAVWNAVRAGILPEEALRYHINAVAPSVNVRDTLKEARMNELAYNAGVLSPQTWAQRLGLDYDREQLNWRNHQPVDDTETDDNMNTP